MDTYLGDILSAHGLAWLFAVTLPQLLAAACLVRRVRPLALDLAPWSVLPALALALWPLPEARYPFLLIGTELGLDPIGRVFLLFTAFLWLCSGVYARSYLERDPLRHRFFVFFLLTASGNLGLIMARDMIGFYLFFVLMTFAAYGLIMHDGSLSARRAGLVYVVLAVFGEVMLITALLIIGSTANGDAIHPAPLVAASPSRDLIIALLLAGFGIKAGAIPLHVWLPLAHPVAPTPASAVLSGAMIKAGLLGWLRFLPVGESVLPEWGALCMGVGLAAAFYGVLIGLTQHDSKTILAYSSISQMGVMTMAVGLGLAVPTAWPLTLTTLLFYALHHSLAKGALFLGAGMTGAAANGGWRAYLFWAGILLAALALAGAPLTSGALAKAGLKEAAHLAADSWYRPLGRLLTLSSVATAFLMSHFVYSLRIRSREDHKTHSPEAGQWLSWLLLLVGVVSVAWWPTAVELDEVRQELLSLTQVWSGLWVLLLGGMLGWLLWRFNRRGERLIPSIPAGDLLAGVVWLLDLLRSPWQGLESALTGRLRHCGICEIPKINPSILFVTLLHGESLLFRWNTAVALFLLLAAALLAIIALM